MLKIKKYNVRQEISLEDFMRLKKDGGKFERYRQDSKQINFGFIFGASARTFAQRTLETNWTEQEADQYIAENRLFGLKDQMIARNPRETPLMWKYLTVATDVRSKFFKTYPGLMERIEREREFAFNNGYIRSWNGAVRRTPELRFCELSEKGHPRGDDMRLYGGIISTLKNIAANTSIQNAEAVLVMNAIVQIAEEFEARDMKSYIFGSVHDSIDLVIHKSELKEAVEIIREVCERPDPENLGMHHEVDIVVADLTQGEYYKGGKDPENYLPDGVRPVAIPAQERYNLMMDMKSDAGQIARPSVEQAILDRDAVSV